MDPKKLNLSGITPKRPLSEEEVGKAYLESMIMLPAILQALLDQMSEAAGSLSIISLYFEKKGIEEKLFTTDDLTGDDDAE
jgi:hypothetical protein